MMRLEPVIAILAYRAGSSPSTPPHAASLSQMPPTIALDHSAASLHSNRPHEASLSQRARIVLAHRAASLRSNHPEPAPSPRGPQ